MSEQMISVLIADDQRLVREGIASLLELQDGIQVVGMATNGEEALNQALALKPNVILMDVRMPKMDGISAVVEIRKQLPECQVLMLTTFDDEEYIVKSLTAGARGYLLKDIPAHDLAQAVRLTYAGIYQLSPSVAGKLVGQLAAYKPGGAPAASDAKTRVDLTDRELEVLKLVATGATNREIAEKLSVSEGTVKNHMSNILTRLGLRDRLQAALFAREHGLVR